MRKTSALITTSLPELMYEKLRQDILDGVLKPGQILRQEELARSANVSRVPLREAMSKLESEGLIVLRPRRGYAVTSLQQSDIVEIFELRAVMEEHAGYIAARARTTEDVEIAGRLLLAMESREPVDARNFGAWARDNYDFHSHIIASSHRPRLLRIASSLRDSVEHYVRVEAAMTGHVNDAFDEHREIFEAFEAGDAAGLARISREHVQNTAQRLLKGLRQESLREKKSPLKPAPKTVPARRAQAAVLELTESLNILR